MKRLSAVLFAIVFCLTPVCGQTETDLTDAEIQRLAAGVCQKKETPDPSVFEKYRQAIRIQPKNYRLYLERAQCFAHANDFQAMLADVSTVLDLVPGYDLSLEKRLTWVLATIDKTEAARRADYLTTNKPNHYYSYLQSFFVKLQQADNKGAFEVYLKMVELEPRSTYSEL